MLYLAVGNNTFAKKELEQALAKDLGLEPRLVTAGQSLAEASGSDLFGTSHLIVLQEAPNSKELEEYITRKDHILVSLGGKTAAEKKLVAKMQALGAGVHLCPELGPDELMPWINSYATSRNLVLSPLQLKSLLDSTGGWEEVEDAVVQQWWLASAVESLVLLAEDGHISDQDFLALVPPVAASTAMEILDALSKKQSDKVASLLQSFLGQQKGEEKALAIQLVSLLIGQLRVWSVVGLVGSNVKAKNEALATTGWKPGRWFYAQKAVGSMNAKLVLESLRRLSEVESELKTNTLPPGSMVLLALQPLLTA